MHFWIDKRSQAYGFGRSRVAASLSGSGFDFGPPRRISRKSVLTPIHRFRQTGCGQNAHRLNHSSIPSGSSSRNAVNVLPIHNQQQLNSNQYDHRQSTNQINQSNLVRSSHCGDRLSTRNHPAQERPHSRMHSQTNESSHPNAQYRHAAEYAVIQQW